MKTRATRSFHGGLLICLCLVFSPLVARCQPAFGGITSYSIINLNGNQVTMDSFNSADVNHSIWQTSMTWHGVPYGVYSDNLSYNSNSLPSRTSDFTLATDESIINVGDADIYGFVDTAPGGSASLNANGSVGDLDWVSSTILGIEKGHAKDDMNIVFSSKTLPALSNYWQSTWRNVPIPPTGSIINIGGTWTNIAGVWTCVGGSLYTNNCSGFYLPSGGGSYAYYTQVITNMPQNTNYVYYSISQLNQKLFVDAPNVVLHCTNGIALAGSAELTLNSNADVSIYSSGNINISSPNGLNNLTQYARALSIYDVAGATNLVFSFYGNPGPALIYAPGSSVSFSESGAGSSFIGAIFCNAIQVRGHYTFHYDESLAGESFPSTPWFTRQPAFETVQIGSNATFTVAAAGPPPITYQWFFCPSLWGGVSNVVVGATNSSLTITNVQPANVGIYTAIASNPYGSASAPGSLIVYTNAAATLSGVFNTNGQFQLNVTGVTRLIYTLEASTNLIDWVPVWTNESPFIYTDSNALPQRYYRAVFAQ